ncbi:flagellin N-terminal helical domain-containing protein [Megalodesulfovibrio paquesii]
MAISKVEQYLVYDTSQQLLEQDLLTNMLFYGGSVGKSLRQMVLSSQQVQPLTNPYDEAITGSLRADARTTMQNSKNVAEAASMVGIAKTGVDGIQSSLEEMQQIIADINSGKLNGSDATVQGNYNDLKAKILGYITNTSYNGISLLDNSKWDTSQIDANGNVYIQAFKNGGFNVQFTAVKSSDFSALSGASLANGPDRATQLSLLTSLSSSITSLSDRYNSRQTSLTYQADQLKAQSELLDQAVEARRQTPTLSEEDALLNLILKAAGSLLDETS